MYNPITAIKYLYHKLIGREEIKQQPLTERERALLDLEKRLDERRRLQAYASAYRCRDVRFLGYEHQGVPGRLIGPVFETPLG